jgi:integrase
MNLLQGRNMNYNYYFKGTYYFRKAIHQKHLIDRDKNLIFRRSLRLCMDKHRYSYLAKNKDTLDKLCHYVNLKLTVRLKEQKMDVTDINWYIQELCDLYWQEAVIEGSDLEEQRIKDLEYISQEGMQHGYLIQAITQKFKELDDHYLNLSDTKKTQKLGVEIVKHSNISNEDILKIPPEKLITFYEKLIKHERDILDNDIQVYIKRNLFEFLPLFNPASKTMEEKINEAYFNYLSLVRSNKPSTNYIKLINSLKSQKQIEQTTPIQTKEDLLTEYTQEVQEDEIDILDTKPDHWKLLDKYVTPKRFPQKGGDTFKNSVRFFCEFLDGNDSKDKAISIEKFTQEDLERFSDLMTECPPKNKSYNTLTLFELVIKRKEENLPRMMSNSMKTIQDHIREFWGFLCEEYNTLDKGLIEKVDLEYELSYKKEATNEWDPELRALYKHEAQKIIDQVFNEKALKKILMNQPRNFYTFAFGYFLGMRISEIILIKIEDIKVQEHEGKKIYYIWLNEDNELQDLKNKNAHRNIIISDLLIELGFLNYVNLRKKRDKKWLFDFPPSKSAPVTQYWSRKFQELFPDDVKTETNRPYNYINFRSLRKSFVEINLSENSQKYATDQNKKRLQGHDSDSSEAKTYLGRLEPYKGKYILDSLDSYGLDLSNLKHSIKNYHKTIIIDINIIQEHKEEWAIKSRVRLKRKRNSKKKKKREIY